MEVYLQGPNGEEVELKVVEPDPADGTFCVLEENLKNDPITIPEDWWIRIVP